jgi:hypothetical protein
LDEIGTRMVPLRVIADVTQRLVDVVDSGDEHGAPVELGVLRVLCAKPET